MNRPYSYTIALLALIASAALEPPALCCPLREHPKPR